MASSSLCRRILLTTKPNSLIIINSSLHHHFTTSSGSSSSGSDSDSTIHPEPEELDPIPDPNTQQRKFEERPLENGLDTGIYRAILVGKVGQNAIEKKLRSGRKVTMLSIGTGGMRNNRRPLQNEEPRDFANRSMVQWHRVSIYPERLGALVAKNAVPGHCYGSTYNLLNKCSILYLEGNLETKIFNDPITGLTRRVREVAVRRDGRVVFLQNGSDGQEPYQAELKGVAIKLSRRQLAICTKSSLLLVLTSQFQDQFHLPKARAQEEPLPQNVDVMKIESNTPISPEDNPVDTSNTTTPTDKKTEETPAETSDTTTPTEESPVENSETKGPTDDNPVETSETTGPTEENQVEASDTSTPTKETPVETSSTATEDSTTTTTVDSCTDKALTKRAFLDISIDGKPIGRVVIGLYGNNVPAGTAKFSDFVSGAAGVSYRRKEFIKITPSYVQHGGVRSYGVDAELAAKTGRNFAVDNLVAELEKENGRCPGTKNIAGTIGIIVRDPLKPPPKQKLVARNGKLVIDEEEIGKDPNGTEFVISTKDSPELDASTLVIGKVLEGMEVVEKMTQVKTVQENTSSPYFRVAKLIGDKRAVVAERGFNRPYSKVMVTNCGLMV
ncbi:Cyclophilin-like peptidyl-prolyl cis-trans isomerase domain-containing protein [Artemisia annua]|uniref:Cyclophilin-like peptidyl-prolyl cis-trans isomerase domain-containing protein n=1 Tax=Artemisia annua TaxID=35608 RepID=A0A2U1MSM8_ARTAN|nr:Cyclophilin-like peptidyl-prolyl cis-trans isomerase domain-containing protein [Artemisia annua]